MSGAVMGLIASIKAAAPPAASYFRCTTVQISIGCCTNTNECGIYGAGISCATQTNPGPNSELNCA